MAIYNTSNISSLISDLSENEQLVVSMLSKIRWARLNNTKALIPQSIGFDKAIVVNDVSINNINYKSITLKTFPKTNAGATRAITPSSYVSYVLSNISVGNKVGVLIDNTLFISTDSDKLSNLKSYLFSSPQLIESFPGSLHFVNGSFSLNSYDLPTLEQDISTIKNSLVASGKYSLLTDKEYFILDLPIILWKLGWRNAAMFALNWIKNGDSLELSDQFFIMNYVRAKIASKQTKDAFSSYNNSENLYDLSIGSVKSNHDLLLYICSNMNVGDSLIFGNNFNNLPTNISDPTPVNFIGSTSIGSKFGDLDDLGASFGRFRYSKYVNGTLHKITNNLAHFNINSICFRFGDTFSFNDDDILGSWIDDVYTPLQPEKNFIDYDGMIKLGDRIYREFRKKTGRGTDFFAYTPNEIKTAVSLNINNPIIINL